VVQDHGVFGTWRMPLSVLLMGEVLVSGREDAMDRDFRTKVMMMMIII
jgi:hypothetical protein